MKSRRLPPSQCFGALGYRVGCWEKLLDDGFVRVEVEDAPTVMAFSGPLYLAWRILDEARGVI
jgi:hypothetical protein